MPRDADLRSPLTKAIQLNIPILSAAMDTVTESHLDMTAKIPGIDAEKFFTIANGAKAGCPISRLLNAKVSLNAKLEA